MLESTEFICHHDRRGCPQCSEQIADLEAERDRLQRENDELKNRRVLRAPEPPILRWRENRHGDMVKDD